MPRTSDPDDLDMLLDAVQRRYWRRHWLQHAWRTGWDWDEEVSPWRRSACRVWLVLLLIAVVNVLVYPPLSEGWYLVLYVVAQLVHGLVWLNLGAVLLGAWRLWHEARQDREQDLE